ncbi:hypothetical protein [Desulfovibrio sp. ZJ369]|uniref:hypothetical protein n=1 Tax=Desulfovibrio sp. ZJ369 TaxID=2709793 RepID=UPI00197DA97A|nr:hypothetical protein [Desulfovibrio sp. ZJ369]
MEKKKILQPLTALPEKLYLKSTEMRLQALLFEVKAGKALPDKAETGGNNCFARITRQIFLPCFISRFCIVSLIRLDIEQPPCDKPSRIRLMKFEKPCAMRHATEITICYCMVSPARSIWHKACVD